MQPRSIAQKVAQLACLLVGLTLLSAPAAAQSADNTEESEPEIDARAELDKANRLAGMNALTRSIPHYRKALKAAPTRYPSAQFNLGSVYEGKEEWAKAMFHYQAYLAVGRSAETKKEAKEAIERMKSRIWKSEERLATLEVDVEPEPSSRIYLNGFLMAQDGDITGLEMMPDTFESYEIHVEIDDHVPETTSVTFTKGEAKTVEVRPTKRTYHGTAAVTVNKKGATVKFIPKKLEGPRGKDGPVERTSPMEEPVKLVTGKWLVEVEMEDHHRWVRYVNIRRDKESSVNVKLQEKLPAEIR